ncbi:hypothetical protein GCM10011610_19520 [Nocardia rhizosphaerihabitans]|uniref:Uncharacterized protein n=1 Tax=Nocardia rhizosphaerihabitans TaxID=1691570 RepID=A0ABQ2K9R5_9NOCA|nr:hypothetical protein GCM10011610_19520 [Nocardia rhizosphaerihabitans]
MLRVLQVEREQREHRHMRGPDQEVDHRGPAHLPHTEHRQRHQRMRAPQLDQHEHHQQRDARAQQGDRTYTLIGSAQRADPVADQQQRHGAGDRAGQIELP